jgi:tetratricopeptide (TPR) repeat protein
MLRALLIFLCLFIFFTGNAQKNTIPDSTLAATYFKKGIFCEGEARYDSCVYYFKESEKLYKKAKLIDKQLLSQVYIASSYVSVKATFNKGINQIQDVLERILKELGDKSYVTAYAYNKIGISKMIQSDLAGAEANFKKALEIRLAIYGENHKDVGMSYNNLGTVYESTDAAKAFESYSKALSIYIKTLGPDDYQVAMTSGNLGNMYEQSQDYDKAFQYYKECLRIYTLGGYKKNQIGTAMKIGKLFSYLEKYTEAREYHMLARDLILKYEAEQTIDAAENYDKIGQTYYQQDSTEKALFYFNKSIDIYAKVKGNKDNSNIGWEYKSIGNTLYYAKRYEEALLAFNTSINMLEKSEGNESFFTATA